MATVFQVTDDERSKLDARFSVDQADIILHSRGGAKGQTAAVNTDYTRGLLVLLTRLSQIAIPVLGAWVDSATVQSLPLNKRSILSDTEGSLPPDEICRLLANRIKDVRGGPNSTAKGGNSTKRIRIATGFSGSSEDLAARLGGIALEGDHRSMDRLPAEVLRKATPEYIQRAVQELLAGKEATGFGPSTDYDLIADDGRLLPPKAVFGLALSMALGNLPIEPKHFTAGGLCFDLLRAAGYQIVRKGGEPASPDGSIGKEWPEGRVDIESSLSLDTHTVKRQVWALADEINAVLGKPCIEPQQQDIEKQKISLVGPNKGERLYIKPARHGYSLGLGGNSLVARMEPFMKRLTGRDRDGYAHPHVSRQPYWHVSDYAQVREAAYEFAGATFPLDGDETAADVVAIERRPDLTRTQRESLIQARLGQGTYRKQMLELWDGQCAVTGLTVQSALIASHAKPWAESTDEERLDPCNGLPLTATLDRLFDKYLVAFVPDTGKMLISDRIDETARAILGIPASLRKTPSAQQARYLKLHLDRFESHKVR
ncbi:HNH endonuclease [Paraburkholderia caribensis]|uniref:HNH endonuclease n=1 Tax=Paraburkholderia caribensis TaxID=75105 RepID=UPI0028652DD3|nr:HNH endonuclease signature motif containing protein [Paraburkholderia caribensis]MDR6384012.1 hypothetical protein [Paraburkholderia caribensis]